MSLTPLQQRPITAVRRPGQLIVPNRRGGGAPVPPGFAAIGMTIAVNGAVTSAGADPGAGLGALNPDTINGITIHWIRASMADSFVIRMVDPVYDFTTDGKLVVLIFGQRHDLAWSAADGQYEATVPGIWNDMIANDGLTVPVVVLYDPAPPRMASLTLSVGQVGGFRGFGSAGGYGAVSPDNLNGDPIYILRVTVSDELQVEMASGTMIMGDDPIDVTLHGQVISLPWVAADSRYSSAPVAGLYAAMSADVGNDIPVTVDWSP